MIKIIKLNEICKRHKRRHIQVSLSANVLMDILKPDSFVPPASFQLCLWAA